MRMCCTVLCNLATFCFLFVYHTLLSSLCLPVRCAVCLSVMLVVCLSVCLVCLSVFISLILLILEESKLFYALQFIIVFNLVWMFICTNKSYFNSCSFCLISFTIFSQVFSLFICHSMLQFFLHVTFSQQIGGDFAFPQYVPLSLSTVWSVCLCFFLSVSCQCPCMPSCPSLFISFDSFLLFLICFFIILSPSFQLYFAFFTSPVSPFLQPVSFSFPIFW